MSATEETTTDERLYFNIGEQRPCVNEFDIIRKYGGFLIYLTPADFVDEYAKWQMHGRDLEQASFSEALVSNNTELAFGVGDEGQSLAHLITSVVIEHPKEDIRVFKEVEHYSRGDIDKREFREELFDLAQKENESEYESATDDDPEDEVDPESVVRKGELAEIDRETEPIIAEEEGIEDFDINQAEHVLQERLQELALAANTRQAALQLRREARVIGFSLEEIFEEDIVIQSSSG